MKWLKRLFRRRSFELWRDEPSPGVYIIRDKRTHLMLFVIDTNVNVLVAVRGRGKLNSTLRATATRKGLRYVEHTPTEMLFVAVLGYDGFVKRRMFEGSLL